MFSSEFINAARDELIAIISHAMNEDDEYLVKVGNFVAETWEADRKATEKLTEIIRLNLTED